MKRAITAFALAALVTGASAGCYSVYQKGGKLVYQAKESPVDLSRPLGDSVPQSFGLGSVMVINLIDADCPSVGDTGEQMVQPNSADATEMAMRAYETSAKSWFASTASRAWFDDAPSGAGDIYTASAVGSHGPIQTGPRGGRFYINSNGNKTYVKR